MQTALNLFSLTSRDLSANVRQIAVQWPGQSKTMLSSDDMGFSEIMAALTALPPELLQNSMEQLEWVALEGNAQEFAPLIDLSKIGLAGEKTERRSLVEALIQSAKQKMSALAASQGEASEPGAPSENGDELASLIKPAGFKHGSELMPVLENRSADSEKNPQDQFKNFDWAAKEQLDSEKWQPLPSAFQDLDSQAHPQRSQKAEDILTRLSARHLAANREQAAAATGNIVVQQDPVDGAANPTAARRNPIFDSTPGSFEQNFITKEAKPANPPDVPAMPDLTADEIERAGQKERASAAEQDLSTAEVKKTGSPEWIPITAKIRQKSRGRVVTPAGNAAAVEGEPVESIETTPDQTSRLKKATEKPALFDKNIESQDLQASDRLSDTTAPSTHASSQRNGFQSLMERLASTPGKAAESASTDQEPDSISREMKTDVIRQIVQRMSFRPERLHSKMNIKLKPEFLGQIRLQIHTANQMVTVRMTADAPEVKEIIEKNIHYLKAELIHHGLEIDKFDVLVGGNREGWQNGNDQTGFRQAFQRGRHPFQHPADDSLETHEESPPERVQTLDSQDESNEISYFA